MTTTGYATGKVLTILPNGYHNGHAPLSGNLESQVLKDSFRFVGFINFPTEATGDTKFGYDFLKVGLPVPSEGNTLYVKLIEKEGKPLSALLYEGSRMKEIKKFQVTSKSRLYNILYRLKEKAKNLYAII